MPPSPSPDVCAARDDPRATSSFELTTERLRLVPCSQVHLEGLAAINSDPQVMRYITGRAETAAETQAVIERVQARWARWGYSWWTLLDRESAAVVGAGCVQNLRRDGTEPDPACPLEIGWRVRRDCWRRGFAIEAARAMAQFAFTRLRAPTLLAVCHPANAASIAVMVKLGMRYRGVEDWYAQKVATYDISAATWFAGRPAGQPTPARKPPTLDPPRKPA
jgi:RimJ/RimL family protein N-acetyltransferase